ncbi:MAG TPA: pyridoxal-phosphate dependent enzyme, partial [Trueperaceae bacterium]|nr:pyridoxal-phosphate dependent enzyme [Trueperaceae bacterium]
GTIGLEIFAEMPDLENVLVPTGGGGLLAGVALAIKSLNNNVKVYGVEPELAADATESYKKGRRILWPAEKTTATMADGVRTQQVGELNFEIIQKHVDGFFTATESEILEAAKYYLHKAKIMLEPTGALSLAAYLANKSQIKGKTVLIISGGNFSPEFLEQLF